MSFEDKVNSIIGKPYDAQMAHCWHLVEFLVPNVPTLDGSADSLRTSVKHFSREIERTELKEVSSFTDEDIILLGKDGIFFHAGVYYDCGVVHAGVDGTIFQDMSMISKLYSDIKGLRV